MQKILVIGCSGSGKSTLSKQLQEKLQIPLIHLDQHYWKAGWVESTAIEWEEKLSELVKTPTWIMDGNYGGTLSYRAVFADTIIWLDMPRWLCLYRVFKRTLKYLGQSRPDMVNGCHERFDFHFLHYIWTFKKRRDKRLEALLDKHHNKQTFRLQSPKQVKQFLQNLSPQNQASK